MKIPTSKENGYIVGANLGNIDTEKTHQVVVSIQLHMAVSGYFDYIEDLSEREIYSLWSSLPAASVKSWSVKAMFPEKCHSNCRIRVRSIRKTQKITSDFDEEENAYWSLSNLICP